MLCVGVATLWVVTRPRRQHRSPSAGRSGDAPPAAQDRQSRTFSLPAPAPSSFRNTALDVAYVGNQACLECHRDEFDSYLETTHSRSFADVDLARQPPDGEFFHELSGRHYRVYRDGETLRLREFIVDDSDREVILGDHVARYALGSGNHQRMYLVQSGDFLIEAPITWYPRGATWGMSAGYERDPHQQGFSREIDVHCLYCHSGRVEPLEDLPLRIKVVEQPIGCERCHGPGELHIRERRAGPRHGAFDDTIVNLARLPRAQQEDVCAQCHLSGAANVDVRTRSRADFRPGSRLSDFVVSYRIDRPQTGMTVSGQIEQMRLSRCYQQSESMTCATCHNPHAVPESSEKVDYFRNKCLGCHQSESCSLPLPSRREVEPPDNCIRCHMPRGPTDIPHLSFTHHRIGLHPAQPQFEKLNTSDRLVPIGDLSHLPEIERQRLLGFANNDFAESLAGGLNDEVRDDPAYRELADVFKARARQELERVRSQELLDPDIDAFFSDLHWRMDPAQCIADSEAALRSPHLSAATRHKVVYNLATSHFDRRDYARALPHLQELVTMERSEITFMLLAICYHRQGQHGEAIRLINAAIDDSPERADLHNYLAQIYRELGNTAEADQHLQRARLLARKVPQPGQ